jgi:gamma-aminobutyric acid type B receptor
MTITSFGVFLLLFTSGSCANDKAQPVAKSPFDLNFALINGGSSFFAPIEHGWDRQCRNLGVTCHYRDSNETDECGCECSHARMIKEFIAMKNIHGIAMSPCRSTELMRPIIDEASEAGIPIVTFDTDVPDSKRVAYVGTDNRFLGRTMARLLKQLRPEGGTFAIIGIRKQERVEGFTEEITKHSGRDGKAQWHEVERQDGEYWDKMEGYARANTSAMITMFQTPMRNPNWTHFVDEHRHRNITYIGTDGSDYQLDYLSQRYVDGLVGQLPYEFGSKSLQVLYELVTRGSLDQTYFPTNLVAYNLIPLDLPTLDVDQNLLGNFKYAGLVCFGLVGLSVLACVAWTLHCRHDMVVKAAQPFFLMMTAGGIFIMASTLVPLSFDDEGDSLSDARGMGICMSIPWLAFTGFTVTFSALFSKTWRVNKFFHASSALRKMKVSERDVLAPFTVLITLNFIVLICWTVIDPLTYERQFEDGTDYWNREIASNGSCRSDHVAAYLVPLGLSEFPTLTALIVPSRLNITSTHTLASLSYKVNFSVLCIASWQAFQSRDIKSEFSEGIYIGLAVFSMTQAFLTGIPIVAVVRDIPEVFYLVLTFLLFFLCMVILLLIFLPKFFMQRTYASLSHTDQRRMMASSVRESQQNSSSRFFSAHSASRKEDSSSSKAFRLPICVPENGSEPLDLSEPLENEQKAEVKEEGNDYEPSPRSILESTSSTTRVDDSGGSSDTARRVQDRLLREEVSQPLKNEQEAEVKEEGKAHESRPRSIIESVYEESAYEDGMIEEA